MLHSFAHVDERSPFGIRLHGSERSPFLCGDRGAFAVFDLEQPPGSIATDLQVRGSLLGNPEGDADQELVMVAVSDSIWNVGYQSPSATPVMTQVAPILS